jgi:hypothetical protein
VVIRWKYINKIDSHRRGCSALVKKMGVWEKKEDNISPYNLSFTFKNCVNIYFRTPK